MTLAWLGSHYCLVPLHRGQYLELRAGKDTSYTGSIWRWSLTSDHGLAGQLGSHYCLVPQRPGPGAGSREGHFLHRIRSRCRVGVWRIGGELVCLGPYGGVSNVLEVSLSRG